MSASLPFFSWVQHTRSNIEIALDIYLPPESTFPTRLHEAMRYAVLKGGKRIRPLLVYAAGELFGASERLLTRAAVAIEFIHTYSLVHDDMPCMDNDELRRGRETVHIKYDESIALLVGDALQAQAFTVLAQRVNDKQIKQQLEMIKLLAQAINSIGMCAGQAVDLASVGMSLPLNRLEQMHQLKTGALLRASVLLGAYSGKLLSEVEKTALKIYSNAIGLAFQIIDDILDATIHSTLLGKTADKDKIHKKPTYVSVLGLDKSKILAEKLCFDAHQALKLFNTRAHRLYDLANLIVQRRT